MARVILSDSDTTNAFKKRVEEDGFAIVPACLDEITVELLGKQFEIRRLSLSRKKSLIHSERSGPGSITARGYNHGKHTWARVFCGPRNFLQ